MVDGSKSHSIMMSVVMLAMPTAKMAVSGWLQVMTSNQWFQKSMGVVVNNCMKNPAMFAATLEMRTA